MFIFFSSCVLREALLFLHIVCSVHLIRIAYMTLKQDFVEIFPVVQARHFVGCK